MKKIIKYLYGCFICWAIVVVLTGVTVYAQSVVINELMASNGTIIADEDGDYGDWIELLNLLRQNFPNPFNPSTAIMYGLQERSAVRIKVYSILGREITTLVDEEQQAGTYKIRWVIPQHGLASGVYYYRIEATGLESRGERFVRTKSMVVIQ
jgi:hypothetical protein